MARHHSWHLSRSTCYDSVHHCHMTWYMWTTCPIASAHNPSGTHACYTDGSPSNAGKPSRQSAVPSDDARASASRRHKTLCTSTRGPRPVTRNSWRSCACCTGVSPLCVDSFCLHGAPVLVHVSADRSQNRRTLCRLTSYSKQTRSNRLGTARSHNWSPPGAGHSQHRQIAPQL